MMNEQQTFVMVEGIGGVSIPTFKSRNELSNREQLLCLISDDYKDLTGFRPRFNGIENMTDDELRQWHNQILTDLRAEIYTQTFNEAETSRRTAQAMTRQEWTIGDIWKA